MNRIFSIVLLSASLISIWGVDEDTTKPLPKSTDSIIAEMTKEKLKATNDAIKKLLVVENGCAKNGDLDGAVAIKEYIEGLKKEMEVKPAKNISFNNEKEVLAFIIGKWLDGNVYYYIIDKNGNSTEYYKNKETNEWKSGRSFNIRISKNKQGDWIAQLFDQGYQLFKVNNNSTNIESVDGNTHWSKEKE
jgi:hypothetical protein